jgi:hypothetical protein
MLEYILTEPLYVSEKYFTERQYMRSKFFHVPVCVSGHSIKKEENILLRVEISNEVVWMKYI